MMYGNAFTLRGAVEQFNSSLAICDDPRKMAQYVGLLLFKGGFAIMHVAQVIPRLAIAALHEVKR